MISYTTIVSTKVAHSFNMGFIQEVLHVIKFHELRDRVILPTFPWRRIYCDINT